MPDRLKEAQHKLFVGLTNASSHYDFLQGLGILEVERISNIKQGYNVKNTKEIVVMGFKIDEIVINENNIVIVGEPTRNGLASIYFYPDDINSNYTGFNLYLTTKEGYEIDYCKIGS